MANIVNTINLEYSLLRYASDGYSREIDFYGGFFFPDNEDINTAIWDLGDGTIFEQTLTDSQSEVSRYNSLLNNMVRYTGQAEDRFFPDWRPFQEQIGALGIPKFRIRHVYAEDGEYEARLTLVKANGTAYTSASVKVTAQAKRLEYNYPSNWLSLTDQYTLTENTDLLFNVGNDTGYVELISTPVNPLEGPVIIDFSLKNIINRTDIEYIEWVFGDGTTHVQRIGLGVPVDQSLSTFRYKYPLLPTTLSYEPFVILHLVRNSDKYKINVKGQTVLQQNRVETVVSYEIETLALKSKQKSGEEMYAFNITPAEQVGLPSDTIFTVNVTEELEYIIWKFGDGKFDITPVKYFERGRHVNQVLEFAHRYIAPDYDCTAECIFVYNIPGAGYLAQRLKALRPLLYDKGFNTLNYYDIISDVSSYTRNLNIHVFADYINDQVCTLHVRATTTEDPDSGFVDVNFFSKLSWNIGGRTLIQDKNTTENFGYVTIENFPTPELANIVDIAVDVYGDSSQFGDATGESKELILYRQYSFLDVLILNKTAQERDTAAQKEFLARQPGFILYGGLLENLQPATFVRESNSILTPVVTVSASNIPRRIEGLVTRSVVNFDKLFTADDPVMNFQNRDVPSTVSSRTGHRVQKRDIGFFTPGKTAIILVEPGVFNFTISLDSNINFRKPYYFPDPFIYGSDSSVLNFNVDVNSFHKGYGFGRAYTEPNTSDSFIPFYGYSSHVNSSKNRDLSFVVNKGYVDDAKTDLHGNLFGLFKDVTVPGSSDVVRVPGTGDSLAATFILFNGYRFYDSFFNQKYAFNYGATFTVGDVRVPGWSNGTRTGSFTDNPITTLAFGKFSNDLNIPLKTVIDIDTICSEPNPRNTLYCDSGFFTTSDDQLVLDPISTDKSTWPGTDNYYYTELFEAGVYTSDPYVRPNLEGLNANFTQGVRALSSNDVFDADACRFTSDLSNDFDILFNKPGLNLIESSTDSRTEIIPALSEKNMPLLDRMQLAGTIYVKQTSGAINTFTDSLPYLENKYTSSLYADISSNTIAFDMIYNTYIIQTKENLIIDEVKYVNNEFIDPGTSNIQYEYNQTPFNKISNRLKVRDELYFVALSSTAVEGAGLAIVPLVYKYSTKKKILTNISLDTYNIEEFVIAGAGDLYVEVGEVCLTYNEQINRFHLTYTLKDANKLPYMIAMNFAEYGDIIIKNAIGERFGSSSHQSFVDDSYLATFEVAVSSNTPSLCSCNIGPANCFVL